MENYFNYFTEIEEHFQRKRGSLLLLSTLDWALIETWREAGVPLEAVLRGIDASFEKYESRKAGSRARRINGLAYCTQAVMEAVEEIQEASIGMNAENKQEETAPGFESERIAAHLSACAEALEKAKLSSLAQPVLEDAAQRLRTIAAEILAVQPNLEELERTLMVMEEKFFAALLTSTPEDELVSVREQASRELAPYRRRMQATQIRQIEQQFLHKRLLEKYKLPRFSLFYMSQS